MPDFVCTVARVTTRMGQLVVSGGGVSLEDAKAEAEDSISNDETGIVWEPDIKSESNVELVCVEAITPVTVLFSPYSSAKPCEERCSACLSDKVHIRFRKKDEVWRHTLIPLGEVYSTEFITEDFSKGVAHQQCLVFLCQTCGFRWETPTAKP